MIIKSTFIYLFGRGLPGVISVLAVFLYTRLLSPSEYGQYALAVGGISAASAISIYWVRLSVLRFFSAWGKNVVMETAKLGFFVSAGLASMTLACMLFIFKFPVGNIILATWGLFIALGWFDLNLEVMRAEMKPGRYVTLLLIKASFGLSIGFLLVRAGYGAVGAVAGLLCGVLVAFFGLDWSVWGKFKCKPIFDRKKIAQFFRYGAPLALVFAMSAVMGYLDRFMIALLLDTGEAGLYAASYDLTAQLLTFLMVSVYMAGQPVIFKSFEEDGFDRANVHLDQYGFLLLAIGLPAVVGMSLLRKGFAGMALGPEFSASAAGLIPYISVATFFGGLKAFYADFAFQLTHKTLLQVVPVFCGVVLNVMLNLFLIPWRGIEGAAIATLISFFTSFALSVYLGKHHLGYIRICDEHKKIVFSVVVMAWVVYALGFIQGSWGWMAGFLLGSFTYVTCLYFFLFKGELGRRRGKKDGK